MWEVAKVARAFWLLTAMVIGPVNEWLNAGGLLGIYRSVIAGAEYCGDLDMCYTLTQIQLATCLMNLAVKEYSSWQLR